MKKLFILGLCTVTNIIILTACTSVTESLTSGEWIEDVLNGDSDSAESIVSEVENKPDQLILEEIDNQNIEQMRPTEEMVKEVQKLALDGMSQGDISSARGTISEINFSYEWEMIYDNLYEKLSDPTSLKWNQITTSGDIQIGWAFSGDATKEEMEQPEIHGVEVMSRDNQMDADSISQSLQLIKSTVNNEDLKQDLENAIEAIQLAKESRDVEDFMQFYEIIHDLDCFVFRYALEEGKDSVQYESNLGKYHHATLVYQSVYSGKD